MSFLAACVGARKRNARHSSPLVMCLGFLGQESFHVSTSIMAWEAGTGGHPPITCHGINWHSWNDVMGRTPWL